MKGFWKLIGFISDKMKVIGAACLVIMTLLTCVDVVGRFLRHPVFGSVEIMSFLGTFAVAMALPMTHAAKGHIGVEIVVSKLSRTVRTIIDLCTSMVSLVLFGLVGWQMYDYSLRFKESGEVSMNLELPEYLIIFVVACTFVVFTIIILKDIIESIQTLRKK
jgi:TRAP-type C4-dicarboxylate transport system permease small subunit